MEYTEDEIRVVFEKFIAMAVERGDYQEAIDKFHGVSALKRAYLNLIDDIVLELSGTKYKHEVLLMLKKFQEKLK